MKGITLNIQMVAVMLATGLTVSDADKTAPIPPPDLVFEEVDGIVAVEAEHFHKQTLTGKRA